MIGSSSEILVTRSSMPPFDEYAEEVRSLWDSHWLTNCGAKHQLLKQQLEKYFMVDHVELFTNGHAAIEAALEAFDIHGEVITTPFTFASTSNAVVRRGATPVFVDVEPTWLTIDPSKIEEAITDKAEAILAVHVYGNLCDVDAIQAIADKYGLKVIYDAAHAFGVVKNGVGAMAYGDASAVSFHATKVFNTIEGGAVCTSDSRLAVEMARNRNFGLDQAGDCVFPGGNAKMNEFCAAMGLCNLRHVDEEIAKRRKVFDEYRECLDGINGIRIPPDQDGVERNCAYFPIFIDPVAFGANRDEFFAKLGEAGIRARKYFYPAINDTSWYSKRCRQDTPVARKASETVLTLPMYADLAQSTVRDICTVIKSCGH